LSISKGPLASTASGVKARTEGMIANPAQRRLRTRASQLRTSDKIVMSDRIKCYGWGALVRDIPGKPHRYIGANAGGWEVYGEILAKKY